MNERRNSSQLPKKWSSYVGMNRPMVTIPVVPFKVPIRRRSRETQLTFNFDNVRYILSEKFKAVLSHVIDLTQTDRYYCPEKELISHGIGYTKIYCRGGPELLPSSNDYQVFKQCLINQIEKVRQEPSKKLIGIHCTHGLNRTGYMICKFLMENYGIVAEEAISEFETARGYKIERAHVVKALLDDGHTK